MKSDGSPSQQGMVLMQDIPENIFWEGTESFDGIQQVVPNDNDKSKDSDHTYRQKYQRGKDDHAQPDRPDDLQYAVAVCDIEGPCKVDDNQFNEDQPESACEQEFR